MRVIFSEYGLLVCTLIGALLAFTIVNYVISHYKTFSKNFIGCITGSYVEYDTDISLSQIEEGLF